MKHRVKHKVDLQPSDDIVINGGKLPPLVIVEATRTEGTIGIYHINRIEPDGEVITDEGGEFNAEAFHQVVYDFYNKNF
jgi:hypothetical protein